MNINRDIVIRNIATICVLGNLLYWLFPFPPIVWRLAIIGLSLLTFLIRDYKLLGVEKIILCFSGLWFSYYLLAFIYTDPLSSNLGNVLCNFSALCLFSYLGSRGVMSERYFTITAFLLIICCIPFYYHYQQLALLKNSMDEYANVTNNASAVFLMILPILLFLKNKVQSWVTLVVCLFFIIMSAKRGNMLACIFPLFLFVVFQFKDSKNAFTHTATVMLLIGLISYLSYYWAINNDYVMLRLERTIEGDSSSRDVLYSVVLNGFLGSDSYLSLLLGHGYDGTIYYINKMAHNDWLQCLFDYGLIGTGLYLLLLIQFIKIYRSTKNAKLQFVILASLAIWFVKSIYSMSILSSQAYVLMISFGSALGISFNEQEEQNEQYEEC